MNQDYQHQTGLTDEPSRQQVWAMFDRIAPRYDMLNRLLSFRRDVAWRNRMATMVPDRSGLVLLDIATGTADQIISLMTKTPRIAGAVGVDMSEGMLSHGRVKIERLGWQERVTLKTGDAMSIPEPDQQFDVATMSFGIRNVLNVTEALREVYRVLKPGGRALILEFSTPGNPVFRPLYFFYLRHLLPIIGGILSGDRKAYRYLNRTIETFPSGEAFCAIMKEAGFINVSATPLTLGIASIYQGDRAG
ncbi:MAG TPA: bifunctional demethylmenaquinone methyltransferase/2-methoxy-6-polyprenyl-1,4-benzoquinol methylase UbiE [Kiritimatiellia bacterium]|nr:bifunctional demethylmenaquinone methyltransferase/2-methoxy-6-polyprenyl-1,4-benzoquinol methylase UbiE [Kiritimatiellia bacterium]HMP00230.1 bifunctional demethylmenaquinone methyltransferase/2-methoxy-6-polyprenyl-1,4-benzoquinol methylase UbiE [Kiritimatiellia bacterium]HMP97183.1 bifunctional demethylmenaquinone methyltransferase/2-methoxy-6-polyprenyl-1,4-benzoquinol methylase UbiE [Kiritimatiellia bacterium]